MKAIATMWDFIQKSLWVLKGKWKKNSLRTVSQQDLKTAKLELERGNN